MSVRIVISLATLLSGCATASSSGLVSGHDAYTLMPAATANNSIRNYRIGPLDTIAITVFQEPDLSVKGLQVDAVGNVVIPLIGEVQAGGKTSGGLGDEISHKLDRYLEHPVVAVTVQESVSQRVTVEGAVIDAGVYEIKGKTSLLDALAMAKGLSRTAAYDDIAIFRIIDGKRTGALFHVGQIYRGQAEDPEIIGSDVVVVGRSAIKALWLDILTASPLISAVRP